MQAASSNFTQAITGSSGVWAPPQVLADWVGDGYDQVKTPDIRDYFGRTSSLGWGRADSGHIWTPLTDPADFFVAGDGTATISMSTINSRAITIGGMITDFDVRLRVCTNQLATGQAQRASIIGRVLSSNTFYLLRCDFNIDQVVGYGMTRFVGGVETTFSAGLVSGVSKHAVGRKFWLRGQGVGNTFRLKIWDDGADEPTAWTASAIDGALAGPGQAGFRASVVGGNTNTAPLVYTVDHFSNGAWDDLTKQAGGISVHQALDDGLPSDITYTSGSDSTSSASLNVADRAGLSAAQYWSQDATASPIAAYERDIPAVTVAAGPVSAGGLERVTVFTGQMSDAPVQGVTASVDAVSKTRLALTKAVQPPPVWGDNEGLNATWPVSWALAQCGIYASPPPRTGCVWWAPMHGSMHPVINNSPLNRDVGGAVLATFTSSGPARPQFVTGPFVLGAYADAKSDHATNLSWATMELNYGAQLFAQQGNAGRLEFWVRLDPITVANVSNTYITYLVIGPALGGTPNLFAGIDKSFRPFIQIADGTNTNVFPANPLTMDGKWHFLGFAWDIAANTVYFRIDGVSSQASPTTPMTTANLPTVLDPTVYATALLSNLPIAEVQVTSGPQANPSNYVWVNDPAYPAASAVIRPSIHDLAAIAETQPIEAASYIATFAQAELAATRTDEQDRFCYLPLTYWAETAQQATVDTLSTASNVGTEWSVTRDLTKIRNQVTVSYTAARLSNDLTTAVQDLVLSFNVYTLAPGTTKITLPLTYLTVDIATVGAQLVLMDAASIAAGDDMPGQNIICVNSAPDGSGTFQTNASLIDVRVSSWDSGKATITVVNKTGATYYTANTGIIPYIRLCGTYLSTNDASVTVQDDASITKRGVRGLNVSLSAIQDADTALFVASELLARSRSARRQLAVTVRGDPRRQPGDLVAFKDPSNTNASGLWRVLSIDHSIDGASYTQALTAVEAALVGVWDQSTWDDGSIWGP